MLNPAKAMGPEPTSGTGDEKLTSLRNVTGPPRLRTNVRSLPEKPKPEAVKLNGAVPGGLVTGKDCDPITTLIGAATPLVCASSKLNVTEPTETVWLK